MKWIAKIANIIPMTSAPVSPIKISEGSQLKIKKAKTEVTNKIIDSFEKGKELSLKG